MKFTTTVMTPIDFAPGITEKVGEKVVGFGANNVLVVTDAMLVELGMVDKVIDSLDDYGIESVIYDKVLPDPPSHLVAEAVEVFKENDCDCIVAIGGGSTMDVGKMTKLMLSNDGELIEYCDFNKPQNKGPKLICIPTTSGTGSEVTIAAVFTDVENNTKHCVAGEGVKADLALIDPELTVGMPPKLTTSTGFDTLAHAVESYICNFANGYSDVLAEKAIEGTINYLGAAYKDGKNVENRSEMSRACVLAGMALTESGLTAGHSMAHALGAHYHIPHGVACALSLPWMLEYLSPVIEKKTRALIKMFSGDPNVPTEKLGETIRELVIDYAQSIDLPLLHEFENVKEEDLYDLAVKAHGDIFGFLTPRNLEVSDYQNLYKKMYEYRR